MADIQAIANQLSELTVMEAAQLSKLLEEKWGVSAAAVAPMMVAAAGGPAAGGAAAPAEEKTRAPFRSCPTPPGGSVPAGVRLFMREPSCPSFSKRFSTSPCK